MVYHFKRNNSHFHMITIKSRYEQKLDVRTFQKNSFVAALSRIKL